MEVKYYRETQKQTNCLHTTSPSLRELKIGRHDGNEKDNKAIGFYNEKNNFATFFCIFLCLHCTTTTRKCLISLFTEEVHKRRRNFLSLSFYHFIGVSSADWSYIFGGTHGIRRSYPVYHSIHDTFYWIKKFVDPEFKIHLALTKYTAIFLLELSDSALLPFNTQTYGELLQSKAKNLKTNSQFQVHNISTDAFIRAVKNFAKISREFEKSKAKSNKKEFRTLNDQMMQVEKAFVQTIDENNPKQLRHVIFGPNLANLYGGVYFPRVNHAIEMARKTGDWELVKKEISVLTYSINSAASVLKRI